MFLAAVGQASNPSQPNTVTEIRYRSRNSTARDHIMITEMHETPGHYADNEFWHGTRTYTDETKDETTCGSVPGLSCGSP